MIDKLINDVIKIEHRGITFSDGTVIVFKECITNFQKENMNKDSKCVAKRDVNGQPPYFEFYTNDNHIRVVFAYKGIFAKTRNGKAFLKLQRKMYDFGYTTFDLS